MIEKTISEDRLARLERRGLAGHVPGVGLVGIINGRPVKVSLNLGSDRSGRMAEEQLAERCGAPTASGEPCRGHVLLNGRCSHHQPKRKGRRTTEPMPETARRLEELRRGRDGA